MYTQPWGQPFPPPPMQPNVPPQPPNPYRAEVESLNRKIQDMEARMQSNYAQNNNSQIQQTSQQGMIVVNNESEITPHITSYNFVMSGQKLTFFDNSTSTYIDAWHDATIPKTIKEYYDKRGKKDEEIVDFMAIAEDDEKESPIMARFDQLEGSFDEFKQLVLDKLENAKNEPLQAKEIKPRPKPLKTTKKEG